MVHANAMFNLTVEDASKRLGVGRARVNQLIRSGMLAAEKVGGIWLIDEQSVEARRNAAPKAGRPKREQIPFRTFS